MLRLLGSALAVLGLAVFGSGCYAKATAYEAKFTFGYTSGLDVDNFIKPIAPGAKLDIVAFANGTSDKLTITKATSTKSGVLAIDKVDGQTVTLKGVAPGLAEIELTATGDGGKVLVDKMFFHVAKPAVHAVEHSCTEGRKAAYVRGENVDVFHNLSTGDRRRVIGYEYAPVSVEPAGALELIAQPQGSAIYRFKAKAANPNVVLRSTVDQSELSIDLVDRASLKEADLHEPDFVLVGDVSYVVAQVIHGAVPLCSQNALTKARSLTPAICTVSAKLDDEPGGNENHEQLALVTGLKFGVCAYEVSLPELAGGRGIVLKGKVKIGRIELPRGSGEDVAAPARIQAAVQAPLASALSRMLVAMMIVGGVEWRRRRRSKE